MTSENWNITIFKSHNGFYCQKKNEFKISCFQKSVLFQGLTTDKPSSETWVYRNYYNNSSVQMMQCCLTSKSNKTCMYLSTDSCSFASMSNQLFLKQLILISTTYVFICFKLDNFFGRVKTALQQFTWQNWRSLRTIGSLKERVFHRSVKIMRNRLNECIVCDSRIFMQFLWNS